MKRFLQRPGAASLTRASLACAGLLAFAVLTALPAATPAFAQFFPFFGSPEPQRQAPRPRSQGLFPWFNAPQEQPHDQQRRAPPAAREADFSKAPPPKKVEGEAQPASTVVVYGDSMADWLSYGLEEAFAETPEIGVLRKVRAYSGLLRYAGRSDQDWAQVARENLAELKPSIIVILVGLGDRQSIRTTGEPNAQGRTTNRSIEFRADQWDEAYGRKVDEMIGVLKSKGVPVVWVGVPAVRGTRSTSDFSYLNDIFRQHAEKAGIAFVDVWDGFVDEGGRFMASGPDVDGQNRRLRTADGVHFTQAGARKLAHYVEREIRRLVSTSPQAPLAVSKGDDAAPAQPGSAPDVVRARPVAGPVVPLTATTGGGDELVGGGRARPLSGNSLAARVLVRGEAISPPKGRADDFGWHGADTQPVAAAPTAPDKPEPETVAATEPAASASDRPSAQRAKTGQAKPDHAKTESAPAAAKPSVRRIREAESREPQTRERPSAQTARPVPPRPIGRSEPVERRAPRTNAFDPFDIFR